MQWLFQLGGHRPCLTWGPPGPQPSAPQAGLQSSGTVREGLELDSRLNPWAGLQMLPSLLPGYKGARVGTEPLSHAGEDHEGPPRFSPLDSWGFIDPPEPMAGEWGTANTALPVLSFPAKRAGEARRGLRETRPGVAPVDAPPGVWYFQQHEGLTMSCLAAPF